MKDIPIAVIRGATLGAWRSGRYATRSIVTLIAPQMAIVARKTRRSGRMMAAVPALLSSAPTIGSRKSEMNPPSVNRSPCAKLISSMMP